MISCILYYILIIIKFIIKFVKNVLIMINGYILYDK